MELDHLFLFVSSRERAEAMMAEAGLCVNYSRSHPGQGTTNLCACLDDMFVELLWLDGSPVSDETERITLGARGRGEGSPVGVSWRGPSDLPCEPYAALFLPNGMTIPVARASLDPSLPFVFRTPGGTPPIERTDGLPGTRQRPHLTTLGTCEVRVPDPEAARPLLSRFERVSLVRGPPGLRLTLLAPDGTVDREVEWRAAASGRA